MPILAAAKKQLRAGERRRVANDRRRRAYREAVKAVETAIVRKDVTTAESLIPKMQKALDKAVKAGVLKKNTVSRKKSRIAKRIVSLKTQ